LSRISSSSSAKLSSIITFEPSANLQIFYIILAKSVQQKAHVKGVGTKQKKDTNFSDFFATSHKIGGQLVSAVRADRRWAYVSIFSLSVPDPRPCIPIQRRPPGEWGKLGFTLSQQNVKFKQHLLALLPTIG
jgi:hypothetical protein